MFDGVVDEVGDRLEQQIPVAYARLVRVTSGSESNPLSFAIGSYMSATSRMRCASATFAKTGGSLTFLDFS